MATYKGLTQEEALREEVKDAITCCVAWNFPSLAGGHKKLSWDKATDKIVATVSKHERKRIMKIFASFGKIQLEKPLSGKEFEALFN